MRDALVSMITVQGDTEFASVEQQRHLLASAPTDFDRYFSPYHGRGTTPRMANGLSLDDLLWPARTA